MSTQTAQPASPFLNAPSYGCPRRRSPSTRLVVPRRLGGPRQRHRHLALLQLELERRAAGAAVAATVEETVRRVAELPDSVLDDEELLQASVFEAFERAAKSSLPPILSERAYRERPDLREVSGAAGTWVLQPLRGPKLYKKYSRVFKRRLSPQALAAIRSRNGRSVAGLMKEHMALPPGEQIEARIHLYAPQTKRGDNSWQSSALKRKSGLKKRFPSRSPSGWKKPRKSARSAHGGIHCVGCAGW